MINILDLRDTHEIGGPGKTILETYRRIDRTRFRLHLAVFLTAKESDDSPMIRAARECGMPLYLIRGRNQFDPAMIWHVARLVRRLNVDILHAHEVKSNVIAYLASRFQRVRLVTTLHGWIGNSPKQRLYIAVDQKVVRRFDCAMAVSMPIRDILLGSGVDGRKLRLLHNAIVLEDYRRTPERGFLSGLVRRPLPRPIIVSLGRLSREKGQHDLIDALGLVAASNRSWSAVLAGEGPERPALAERIRELGLQDRVFLPGHVAQPSAVLNDADLLVLPSHTEGLPNAALEALAMEVPVLATRVGGTPEVIEDGETGTLVEKQSPERLATEIESFLVDPAPWRSRATAGRSAVERTFDFSRRTKALEAIYAELQLPSQ